MSLYSELKRRNVIRVAIAYLAVAWLLTQVAETLFPLFGYGDAPARNVVILLAIGFPLFLIFSWVFELTPEGLKLEKDVKRGESITAKTGKKLDHVIIVLLVLALGYFAVDKFVVEPSRDAALVKETARAVTEQLNTNPQVPSHFEKSIAVLPFANRSALEEDVFFVEGIHDDILTQLARIGSLTVISRTSVERFKGTVRSMKEIGAILGVKNILEGGVQRAGDRVRINMQLIDAETDDHLWANTFDRELTTANIFAIQSEIATAIATALAATLTSEESQQIATVPTENMAALEAYFLGHQAMLKRNTASLEKAEDQLKLAIELDPAYAMAYVDLSITYHFQTFYGTLPEDEAHALMEPMLEKAVKINPQLGEAYIAQTWLTDDPDTKEMLFRKGLQLAPGYVPGHQWYSFFLKEQNRPEESLFQLEEALRLDPMSSIVRLAFATALDHKGSLEDARKQFDSIIRIDPDFSTAYTTLSYFEAASRGRLDNAVIQIRKAAALNTGSLRTRWFLTTFYSLLGADQEADKFLAKSRAISPEDWRVALASLTLKVHRGEATLAINDAQQVYQAQPINTQALLALSLIDVKSGEADKALKRYGAAFPELRGDTDPELNRDLIAEAVRVAWLLQQTGEEQSAARLIAHIMEYIQTIPRLSMSGYWITDVQLYALLGRKEEALLAMRRAFEEGWRYGWRFTLKHDPILVPLHDEPEYQAIVEEIAADVAAQLARVRELEVVGELEPIPERPDQVEK